VQPPRLDPLHDRGRAHGHGHGHGHGRGRDHGRGRGGTRHQSGFLRSWPFCPSWTKVQVFVCLIVRPSSPPQKIVW